MPAKKRKTVLVTGGGKRIGAEIVRAFARHGWGVLIHCQRSRDDAAQLHAEIGGNAAGHYLLHGDLLQPGVEERLIAEALATAGKLTALINNASVYQRSPLAQLTPADIQQAFKINFLVPFELMRQFYLQCRAGNIVNLLDQRVAAVDPAAGGYALAKKSLRDATEACAIEWAPAVRVNAVAPGIVLPPPGAVTDGLRRMTARIPLHRCTAATDVAEACIFLAEADNVTGQILFVDGGLHLASVELGEPKCKRCYTI